MTELEKENYLHNLNVEIRQCKNEQTEIIYNLNKQIKTLSNKITTYSIICFFLFCIDVLLKIDITICFTTLLIALGFTFLGNGGIIVIYGMQISNTNKEYNLRINQLESHKINLD